MRVWLPILGRRPPSFNFELLCAGLSPPVWRRVLVPEHLTLGQLHNVLPIVMGWADEHLHAFSIRGRRYGEAHEHFKAFTGLGVGGETGMSYTSERQRCDDRHTNGARSRRGMPWSEPAHEPGPGFVGDSGERSDAHPVQEIESTSTLPMALPFTDDFGAGHGDAQARRRGVPERGGDRCGRVEPLGGGAAASGRAGRL
ncbi:IS1096 element passenger TnpR family protein [Cupriavidus lacunae]|uniref:IS1096 element passenger TnpR family protein n=1 Tax=Cupriavidus lacunae TaxID=2666307 RepID=UPI003CC5A4B9